MEPINRGYGTTRLARAQKGCLYKKEKKKKREKNWISEIVKRPSPRCIKQKMQTTQQMQTKKNKADKDNNGAGKGKGTVKGKTDQQKRTSKNEERKAGEMRSARESREGVREVEASTQDHGEKARPEESRREERPQGANEKEDRKRPAAGRGTRRTSTETSPSRPDLAGPAGGCQSS